MKTFEEETIPKDVPFIIEIKAGFKLVKLLKQIKKAAKLLNNLKNYKNNLPKYIIGVLCSYKNSYVMPQFKDLKNKYNGTNCEDSQLNLFSHITKIIGDDIKLVIAVIKDGYINKYNLGREDYYIDYDPKSNKRVDLLYLYKAIKDNDQLNENDLEKIKEKIENVSENFLKVYETINLTPSGMADFLKKLKNKKKYKKFKLGEKKKIEEEMKKKLEDEMKKKILEEKKKIEEEVKKKLEDEMKKKIEEEKKKIEDELTKKILEERKKMEEEVRKKVEDEVRKKILLEERNKIQEEEKKNKFEEEEKNPKEDRIQNEQEQENHKEKK